MSGIDPEDVPGTPEYNRREDDLKETQARMDRLNQPVAGPDPGLYPSAGTRGREPRPARTPALSKWLVLTFPLGMLAVLAPVHGPHGPIPGVAHFFGGVAIAGLGSPRARAASILLIGLLVAAAVWEWS
jgi:hypothetical protein